MLLIFWIFDHENFWAAFARWRWETLWPGSCLWCYYQSCSCTWYYKDPWYAETWINCSPGTGQANNYSWNVISVFISLYFFWGDDSLILIHVMLWNFWVFVLRWGIKGYELMLSYDIYIYFFTFKSKLWLMSGQEYSKY